MVHAIQNTVIGRSDTAGPNGRGHTDEGERRMLYGAVMLPEQLIYRVDSLGGEYYAKCGP